MKKNFLIFCLAAVITACTNEPLPQASFDIIPQPKEVHLSEEKPFELGSKTVVYYEPSLQREAQFLSEYVNNIKGFAMNVQEYQGQSDGIVLKLVPEDFDHQEAYEIDVTPKQITITGADAAGVFTAYRPCVRVYQSRP